MFFAKTISDELKILHRNALEKMTSRRALKQIIFDSTLTDEMSDMQLFKKDLKLQYSQDNGHARYDSIESEEVKAMHGHKLKKQQSMVNP